jgi:hypothetical protein
MAEEQGRDDAVWTRQDVLRHRASRVVAGDVAGTVCALAAVVGGRRLPVLQPLMTSADQYFSRGLGELAGSRGSAAARMATNNALMMAGGLANPLSQYLLLRRDYQESQPQGVDLAQIVASRIVSTATAGAAVMLAELHAGTVLRSAEALADQVMNRVAGHTPLHPRPMIDAQTAWSETLMHNALQSVGGVAGGALFQAALDQRIGRGAPQGRSGI